MMNEDSVVVIGVASVLRSVEVVDDDSANGGDMVSLRVFGWLDACTEAPSSVIYS